MVKQILTCSTCRVCGVNIPTLVSFKQSMLRSQKAKPGKDEQRHSALYRTLYTVYTSKHKTSK
jgi:hypothetical protein